MENQIRFEDVVIRTKGSKSTVFYDEITSLIHDKAMLNKKQFIAFVNSYVDRNSEAIFIPAPYSRMFFIERVHADPIFQMMGITKTQIKDIIKKNPEVVSSTFSTLNNPFFYVLTGLVFVYGKHTSDKLAMEAKQAAMFYQTLRFYSSRVNHQWPYGADRSIMDYTMNNISNKFLFKQLGSVYKVLMKFTQDNDDLIGPRVIETRLDTHFTNYITNISTKINNILKKLYQEFKKNQDNKNYMDTETEKYDDEKQTIKELQNVSSIIELIAQRTYLKLKENGINTVAFNDAVAATKLKASAVRNTLEDIIEHETSLLKEEIIRILQLFFMDAKHNQSMIKTKMFRMWGNNIYKVSNTNDKIITRQKEILDIWLKEYGVKYIRFNTVASSLRFRKAVFIFIINNIILYS
jgi:hypothetical protein